MFLGVELEIDFRFTISYAKNYISSKIYENFRDQFFELCIKMKFNKRTCIVERITFSQEKFACCRSFSSMLLLSPWHFNVLHDRISEKCH